MVEHDDVARLQILADEVAALDRELNQAVAGRSLEAVADLRARRDRVARERDRLLDRLTGSPPAATAATGPPLREHVLDALRRVERPLDTRQIAGLVWARTGRRVSTAQLSAVRRDDERSYRRRPGSRPEYVVPALVAGRWTPVRGMLASSAWPFVDRLVVGRTARVAFLAAFLAVLDDAAGPSAQSGKRYQSLAETWSRDLLTASNEPSDPLPVWRAAAEEELRELLAEERGARARAAGEAPELSPADRLWGHALHPVERVVEGQ